MRIKKLIPFLAIGSLGIIACFTAKVERGKEKLFKDNLANFKRSSQARLERQVMTDEYACFDLGFKKIKIPFTRHRYVQCPNGA